MNVRIYLSVVLLLTTTIIFGQTTVKITDFTAPITTPQTGTIIYDFQDATDITMDAGFEYTPQQPASLTAIINDRLPTPNTGYISDPSTQLRTDLNTAYKVGTIEGTTDVTAQGQLSYTIPIFTSPGTAGMVPSVQIKYTNGKDNGLLGFGWDIAGLSTITRTGKTLYFDGINGGVTYTNSDPFTYDGQRLVPVTGSNGGNGTIYGTEAEDFNQVISYGTTGNGPSYFLVKTKSGISIEIGNSEDSRLSYNGTVLIWKVNRIYDVNGNYIQFTYRNDGNEIAIDKIEYTGNTSAALAPYNSLDFYYTKKADPSDRYIAGKKISNTLALVAVKSRSEGSVIRSLEFNYKQDLYTKLIEVIEKNGSGEQKNSTVINWESSNYVENTPVTYVQAYNGPRKITSRIFAKGDFNGDGLDDFVVDKDISTIYNMGINVMIATGIPDDYDSYTVPGVIFGRLPNGQDSPNLAVFDFDQNGKDEVYVKAMTGTSGGANQYIIWAFAFNGTAMVSTTNNIVNQTNSGFAGNTIEQDVLTIIPTDIDGDGILEATFLNQSNPNHSFFDKIIEYNAGGTVTNLLSLFNYYTGSIKTQSAVIDFNGNGRSDLYMKKNGVITIQEYNPATGAVDVIYTSSTVATTDDQTYWVDLNADGNTDLLVFRPYLPADAYRIFLSDGTQLIWDATYTYSIGQHCANTGFEFVDLNGDGKTDVLQLGSCALNTYYARIFINDGRQLNYKDDLDYHSGDIFLDVNGDGMTERSYGAYFSSYPYSRNAVATVGPAGYKGGNVVTSIVNGMNVRKEYDYNYLRVNKAGGAYTHTGDGSSFGCAFKYVPLLLVTEVRTIHHSLGTLLSKMTYNYTDGVFDKDWKGFRGFRIVNKTYSKNGQVRNSTNSSQLYNSTFRILYPYTSQTFINGSLNPETSTQYTYSILSQGTKRYWTRLDAEATSQASSGVAVTSSYGYDASGNPGYIYTDNGYSNTTVERTYTNINSYCLNKITYEKVTKANPGNSSWKETLFSYSAIGNLEQTIEHPTRPKNVTTTYINNALGIAEQSTVSASGLPALLTRHEYDNLYRFVMKEYNPLSQKTERLYNTGLGKMTWEKTPDGIFTSYTYDKWGDLSGSTDQYGVATTYTTSWSNPNTNQKDYYIYNVQNPTKPYVTTRFDILGNKELVYTQNHMGNMVTIDYEYDLDGFLTSQSKPYVSGETPQNITYTYENKILDRITTITDGPRTTSFTYSPRITNTVVQGPTGTIESTIKELNNDGSVKQITDLSGTIEYSYNASGQVVQLNNPSGTSTMAYDDYERQTQFFDANVGTVTYEYDAYGRLIYQKDALDNEFTMQYDGLGRITTKTESATGKQLTYSYKTSGNGLNQVSLMKDFDNYTKSYSYDSYQRVSAVTENVNGANYTTSYTYQNDDITGITYPSGYAVTRLYNAVGAVATIKETASNKTLWQLNTVNAMNQPTQEFLQNGYQLVKSYNSNLPLDNKYNRSDNSSVLSYTYSFDIASGNLLSRKDNIKAGAPMDQFQYDNMQRLTVASTQYKDINNVLHSSVVNTSFFANGNIRSKSDVAVSDYQYALITNAVTDIPNPYSSIPSFDQQIDYNTSRQMVQNISENNKILSFNYGPDDRRKRTVLKDNGTQVNEHIYIGDYEKEIKSSGPKEYHYLYTPYALLGVMIRENGADKFYYAYSDYLGTLLALVNENGTIAEEWNADAWGRRRNPQDWTYTNVPAPVLTTRCFTGHEHLEGFGLINMNARLYDPLIGRMLSPDNFVQAPEYTQNLNRYSYAFNNPLKYNDPTGNYINQPSGGGTIGGGVNTLTNFYELFEGSMLSWEELDHLNEQSEREAQILATMRTEEDQEKEGGEKDVSKKGAKVPNESDSSGDPWYYGFPAVGTSLKSGQQLTSGNYAGAIATFGIALIDLFTFGEGTAIIAAERLVANELGMEGAVWAQKTFSSVFSMEGKFSGQAVSDVASALKNGTLSTTEVPINIVVRNGQTFILNTRSSAALTQAGIPRSAWNVVNKTGVPSFEKMLSNQLKRNGLTNGTNTIRQKGTQLILKH